MAEVGPSFDTSDFAKKSEVAAVTVLSVSVAVGGQTVTTYGPASGAKVSVVMLPDSGV